MDRVRNIVKLVVGVLYLAAGPLVHLVLLLTNRGIYTTLADQAWGPYKTLWQTLVVPRVWLWVPLLMLFEAVVGWLMLRRDPAPASRGQALGALFNLFLVPLWPMPYNLTNLAMAGLHVWLLRGERAREQEGQPPKKKVEPKVAAKPAGKQNKQKQGKGKTAGPRKRRKK